MSFMAQVPLSGAYEIRFAAGPPPD